MPRAPRSLLLSLLLLAALPRLPARTLRATLWISGGLDDLVFGGDNAPGWLSVSQHVAREAPDAFWIDAGGGSALACLRDAPSLRLPDALVPGEHLLRSRGTDFLSACPLPWALLNAGRLPQFPAAPLPTTSCRLLENSDGLRIRVTGLLDIRSPLRIPTGRLQPLRVLPGADSLREALTAWRQEPATFNVLVLPENSNPADWTSPTAEFPLLIEPAADPARVVELDGGRRLRVRPGRFGRSLVRVELAWDNTRSSFAPPRAEVVWTPAASPETLPLPPCALPRLRPHTPAPSPDPADLSLLPAARPSSPRSSPLPDALRAERAPHDTAFVLATVPSPLAREWMTHCPQGFQWSGAPSSGRETRVLLPAEVAAGLNGETLAIRKVLDHPDALLEFPDLTFRDLLVPLP